MITHLREVPDPQSSITSHEFIETLALRCSFYESLSSKVDREVIELVDNIESALETCMILKRVSVTFSPDHHRRLIVSRSQDRSDGPLTRACTHLFGTHFSYASETNISPSQQKLLTMAFDPKRCAGHSIGRSTPWKFQLPNRIDQLLIADNGAWNTSSIALAILPNLYWGFLGPMDLPSRMWLNPSLGNALSNGVATAIIPLPAIVIGKALTSGRHLISGRINVLKMYRLVDSLCSSGGVSCVC